MIVEVYGYAVLGLIIILLFIEREVNAGRVQKEKDKMLEEISKLVKALISKNANDYVMTASIDKVAPENKPPASLDEMPEETLSDDQFFDAIGKGLKDKK